jgi:hypothetical protein
MDSAVQLALMSKAKKVFGADDTFLSFPVSPLPYTGQQLNLMLDTQDADVARERWQNLEAFSTLVNLIPSDEAWLPTETRFLWDVYQQILAAEFAFSTRTPQEETAYQQALAYLRTSSDGVLWQDSPPVQIYKQYKDAYYVALQAYTAAKGTAENSTDPEEKKRWQDEEEPRQRAALDALQADWVIKGYKNEVEDKQSVVERLGAKSPLQTRAEWKNRFNPDIDGATGAADNFTAYPSFFSPSNALEEGAWRPFKLSEQEIRALLEEAPAELRARLGADGTSSVASLAFEFSSAAVLRPWFASEALRARFWRFQDAGKILSDGTRDKGECPAYVTAIVFARHVTVVEKQPEPGGTGRPIFDGFRFEVAVRDPARLAMISQGGTSPILIGNMQMRNTATLRAAPLSDGMAGVRMAPQMSAVHRVGNLQSLVINRLVDRIPTTTTTPPAGSTNPPQSTQPTPTTPDETVYILAFICKAVPLSPNPDLTLQW